MWSYGCGFGDSNSSRSGGGSSISRTDEKFSPLSYKIRPLNIQKLSTLSSFSVHPPMLEYRLTFSACDIIFASFDACRSDDFRVAAAQFDCATEKLFMKLDREAN